jgi:hypothetical protein
MAYDALHMRNTIQLLALLIFHAALVVFASLQAYETDYSLTNAGDCGELVRPLAPVPAPPLTAAAVVRGALGERRGLRHRDPVHHLRRVARDDRVRSRALLRVRLGDLPRRRREPVHERHARPFCLSCVANAPPVMYQWYQGAPARP